MSTLMTSLSAKWLYAIGDIHGCYDQLVTLLDKIEMHADGAPFTCVVLGDYVDRGPQSRDVVEHVKRLCAAGKKNGRYIAIRGNHEQLMIDACGALDGDAMAHWYENGGDATIESYKASEDDLQTHLAWLRSLPLFHETNTTSSSMPASARSTGWASSQTR